MKHQLKNTFQFFFIIIVCSLLLSLGFWQLHRAHYKQNLLHTIELQKQAQPLRLSSFDHIDDNLAFRRVRISGHFDNKHPLLLDNKFYHHKFGYEVITPFVLAGQQQIILVNRGWIPGKKSRNDLPAITPILGQQQLTGTLDQNAERGFILGDALAAPGQWPLLIEKIDFNKINQRIGKTVLPLVLLLDKEDSYAFARDWQPVIVSPARHIAYAVQWFGLAIVAFIGFIMLFLKRNADD